MAKVFWTKQEQIKVFAEYRRLDVEDKLSNLSENNWRLAQRVLDQSRWRPFKSSSAASSMSRPYKAWLASSKNTNYLPPVEAPAKIMFIEGAGAMKPETYQAVVAYYKKQEKENPPSLDAVLSSMLDRHTIALLEQISAKLSSIEEAGKVANDNLFKKIMEYFEPQKKDIAQIKEIETHAQAHSEPKPLVVLLNAKEDQRKAVQNRYPQLDIRKSVDGSVPGYVRASAFIGMTKFMGHDLEEGVISKFGKERYHRVRGSSSAIIAKIGDLLASNKI